MADGDVLLDDDGNVILDDDGNVMLSDGVGDDCCCGPVCEVCVEDTVATVTLSGGEACLSCSSIYELVGALAGTFTLDYDPLSPGQCRYTCAVPYTDIVVTAYDGPGCAGPILNQTDEIRILLFLNTVTGKWELLATVVESPAGGLADRAVFSGEFTPAPGEYCLEDAEFTANDACGELPHTGVSAWIGGTAIVTIAP